MGINFGKYYMRNNIWRCTQIGEEDGLENR